MQAAGTRWLGLLVILLWAGAANAQEIQRTGRGTVRLDSKLDEILSNRSYRILTHDTLIGRSAVLEGPVLTLGNRLVIEGTVRGNLAIVDANVYVRPTARIEGEVINIGGGLYRSEQATITELVSDYPLAPYHVEKENDRITIVGDVEHKFARLDLKPPQANRVEGFRPYFGVTLVPAPFGRVTPELFVWGAYGFELGEYEQALQGGAEFRLRRGLTQVGMGVEETTWTNDKWNRSDFDNTLTFLWHGKDYRNYYEANRQYVFWGRDLSRGGHEAILTLRGQREDAETLVTGDPWVLFEPDEFRLNPFIDDGVITSAILGLRGKWTGLTSMAEYDGGFELAGENAFDGDHDFAAFRVWGEWAMQAIANHSLELEAYFQGPIGTDSLPRQRWSMVGGSGTLPTFAVGEFFGDRVAFLESKYSIPLGPRLRLPVIGAPKLQFVHDIGMAWTFDESRRFEQNLGVKLQFRLAYVRLVTNPRDTDETKFSVGVTFPKGEYPWERRSRREP